MVSILCQFIASKSFLISEWKIYFYYYFYLMISDKFTLLTFTQDKKILNYLCVCVFIKTVWKVLPLCRPRIIKVRIAVACPKACQEWLIIKRNLNLKRSDLVMYEIQIHGGLYFELTNLFTNQFKSHCFKIKIPVRSS